MDQNIGQSPSAAKQLQAKKKQELAEKRAEALRANLKRRKEQVNGRVQTTNESTGESLE